MSKTKEITETIVEPLPKRLQHPLASKYETPIGAGKLKEYADKIKRENLHEIVVLLDDKILTGRNYYTACKVYDIPLQTREFGSDPDDGPDPEAFVKRVYTKQASSSEQVAPAPEPAGPSDEEEVEVEEPTGEQIRNYLKAQEQIEYIEQHAPDLMPALESGEVTMDTVDAAHRQALEREQATVEPVETSEAETETEGAEDADEEPKKKAQAERLVRMAEYEHIAFFCDHKRKPYAKVPVDGHIEIWPIRPQDDDHFEVWMRLLFYQMTSGIIDARSMDLAIGCFVMKAYQAEQEQVYVRQAAHNGDKYIDLCDKDWRVVKIAGDGSGWQIIDKSPVAFIRPEGMMSLPEPQHGGDMKVLRSFLNVDDDSFKKALMWLLGAYHPTGPYAALLVSGPAGSGKSTLGWILRSLIDPNSNMLRGGGESEENVVIQANNAWLVALDNLSHISAGVSDTLCRILSGAGYSTRRFHTNTKEVLFDASRPALLTSIWRLVSRDDLLDRSIMIDTLRVIDYRSEAELKQEFEQAQPFILGALFNAVSAALMNMGGMAKTCRYRMADFFKWAISGEETLGLEAGTFETVYADAIHEAHALTRESSGVAQAIISFVRACCNDREKPEQEPEHGVGHVYNKKIAAMWANDRETEKISLPYEATATKLLETLTFYHKIATNVGERVYINKSNWPETATQLGNRIRSIEASLRAIGIEITHRKSNGRQLTKIDYHGKHADLTESMAA